MKGLILPPYEEWGRMEQPVRDGLRDFFLQWELNQTHTLLFALADKKRPILRILHFASKYVGGGLEWRTIIPGR